MTDTIKHFIEQRIESDLASGRIQNGVVTRFPPEPNGYLHIGHAKAICLNFGMAAQYKGVCHLRFDDTNPVKEDKRYMDAMQADIGWLGFQWDHLYHAADYFEQLYGFAVDLIKAGKAYVCSLSPDDMRSLRGTLTEPGNNSPYRDRSIEESLDLFARMKAGEFSEGTHTLRAKIDMASGNINMRDPAMYRILHADHPHLKTSWCIYPMYDYAHCLSDAIEGVTHSLCSLEFQDHRPLYDWFVDALFEAPRPQQMEFSRLNISHTLTSKRKLRLLVDNNKVNGWDDPRMPTLIGLRRRGVPAEAIRNLCAAVGVSKSNSVTDMGLLEGATRDVLNRDAARAFCVMDPLKVTLTNWEEGRVDPLLVPNHPQDEAKGTREMPLTKTIYIEQDDFMLEPPGKYRRLAPGREVRLRYGYVIKCDEVMQDAQGQVVELKCSVDFDTLGKNPEGRKVKGVIHWVSATENITCEVREYDRLFSVENPAAESDTPEDLLALVNPHSYLQRQGCVVEVSMVHALPEAAFQFERLGYYCVDRYDATDAKPVFNKVVALRDTWSH